jgi:CDP-glucose 4,6-dehydratase
LGTRSWRGRKVLVTGHTGFKGSWLSAWLLKRGADVTGYSFDVPTEPSLFGSLELERRMSDERGDIRDLDGLETVLNGCRAEVVFHLAAQPLVRASYIDPKGTFETNVMGTVNVLEAVRSADSVRACVCVTSDKCYLNREREEPYREDDALGGRDPYSASKAAAEMVAASYRDSFFRDANEGGRRRGLATARAGNVIGGGDWARDRIVPDCIRALTEGRPVELRSPDAVRPWQHVLEPLWGYMVLAERLLEDPSRYSASWNFGPAPDSHITVRELVELLLAKWGKGRCEIGPRAQMHESRILRLDCSKARDEMGWVPRLTVDEAVRMAVEWYQECASGPQRLWDITMDQIGGYERLLHAERGPRQ